MVPENIRIRFRKTGSLKYISHLDLCRTVCPAMIRAKIPIWYTEGFNPHPKMVFSPPLPLFVESECEFLDIKITQNIPLDELRDRLRAAFTDELYVEDVYIPRRKIQEITYAEYRISGFSDISPDDMLLSELILTKKTKSGQEKAVDIRPQVKSVSRLDNGELLVVLDASVTSYLNPDGFCRALCARFGESDYSIVRAGWYDESLKKFL